ncbi:MAG: PQQ-binding-like beta-propeller repeat protein [Bacteroidetes bacterium]|nr:PQQ-binding-like beta-propeller repeat protein [Bacteroidota bacterium]
MKKPMSLVLFLLSLAAWGQEEMKTVYQFEVDHKFNFVAHGSTDLSTSYVASSKEITVFQNQDGKVVWSKKFNEITDQIKKVDDVFAVGQAGLVFILDRKVGKDKMVCIEEATGKLLWVSDKFQDVDGQENMVFLKDAETILITTKKDASLIRMRTGELIWRTDKFKGITADYALGGDGSIVMINMREASVAAKVMFGNLANLAAKAAAGFKNQIVRINLENGEIMWDQTYRGIVEEKLLTRERLVDLKIKDGKVLLFMRGMHVFDYATGKPQWSASYDETPDAIMSYIEKQAKFGTLGMAKIQKFGAYGVVADPVIVGGFAYVIDMVDKKHQFIKKFDMQSGKMVWQSPEIKDARAIPGLYVSNDKVILQVGGNVEVQAILTQSRVGAGLSGTSNSPNTTTSRGIAEVKPMNVQCFDANTGKQLWESDKMKKGITNLFVEDNNVIVCSGKALYSIGTTSGNENYEVALKEDNISEASMIFPYDKEVIIIGEKGVSAHTIASGKLRASSRYKFSTPVSIGGQLVFGNHLALETPGQDYAVYDLPTMTYKKYDARKGSSAFFSEDGKMLTIYEEGGLIRKSKITKLETE